MLFPEIYREVISVTGIEPDIDLFCSISGVNKQCHQFFSIKNDAFEKSWTALNCYANPPYVNSKMSQVVEKFLRAYDESSESTMTLVLPAWAKVC